MKIVKLTTFTTRDRVNRIAEIEREVWNIQNEAMAKAAPLQDEKDEILEELRKHFGVSEREMHEN